MEEKQQWDVFVGSALRVPGGNPVDGLPPARHTKTIAKRARVGPRTQMHVTMEKLFGIICVSEKCSGISEIVLDNILKLRIELIKSRNDNARKKVLSDANFFKSSKFG